MLPSSRFTLSGVPQMPDCAPGSWHHLTGRSWGIPSEPAFHRATSCQSGVTASHLPQPCERRRTRPIAESAMAIPRRIPRPAYKHTSFCRLCFGEHLFSPPLTGSLAKLHPDHGPWSGSCNKTPLAFSHLSHFSLPAMTRPLSVKVPVAQQQALESFGLRLACRCHRAS
jgi:hypothetical protein